MCFTPFTVQLMSQFNQLIVTIPSKYCKDFRKFGKSASATFWFWLRETVGGAVSSVRCLCNRLGDDIGLNN